MITGSWVRGWRAQALLPRRVRSVRVLLVVLICALLAWFAWLWYRSSSFVKVQRVTVAGLTGPDIPQIRSALTSAALTMTTLNVQISKLEVAVEQYPYVRSLTVARRGSHALVIHVTEEVPVAIVSIGGNREVVDAQGRLLPNTTIPHPSLPLVPIASAPAGMMITARGPRAAIAVLAASPYALLPHLVSATSSRTHGVIAQLRNGPQLYFGSAVQLPEKWEAAMAVLQSHDSDGASYIDVSDPQRPAAGAGVSSGQARALGLVSNGTATTTTGQTAATIPGQTTTTVTTTQPTAIVTSGQATAGGG